MRDFTVYKFLRNDWNEPLLMAHTDGSTTIEEWDAITITSGYVTKADATSTSIGIAENWVTSWDGNTEIYYYDPQAVIYEWTSDANFAITNRNTPVDLVINSTAGQIDLWASSTDVFKVLSGDEAGTVWSTSNVRVKINKPIA